MLLRVKSMGDAFGKKSLLCITQESPKKGFGVLHRSDPFGFLHALAKFVQKSVGCSIKVWRNWQRTGKSALLEFNMKLIKI